MVNRRACAVSLQPILAFVPLPGSPPPPPPEFMAQDSAAVTLSIWFQLQYGLLAPWLEQKRRPLSASLWVHFHKCQVNLELPVESHSQSHVTHKVIVTEIELNIFFSILEFIDCVLFWLYLLLSVLQAYSRPQNLQHLQEAPQGST